MARQPDARIGLNFVDLDADGGLRIGGRSVRGAEAEDHLRRLAELSRGASDVFLLVHGWQNPTDRATKRALRFYAAVRRADPEGYPGLTSFIPYCLAVRWPSTSPPLPAGYKRIRDRAHAMTTTGYAAHILASLLGTLDAMRIQPDTRDLLGTGAGQFLHCIGHSFGCRLVGEAIMHASVPQVPPTLGWPWPSGHAFAVDTFIGLQMAALPSIFNDGFAPLAKGIAPIVGPVVLTVSKHDRALGTWHQLMEGAPGVGAVGAVGAPTINLHTARDAYSRRELSKVTNVDASWRYRRGRLNPSGSHSDVWYPETIHLILSLASLSR